MKFSFTVYIGVFCALLFSVTHAQVVTNPATGHSYEFIPVAPDAPITWEEALEAASMRQYEGQNGYLVSITSAEENAFITQHFSLDVLPFEDVVWIGAYEPLDDGRWVWAAGPEAGQQFWDENLGTGTGMVTPPINYANWVPGEPNNANGAFDEFYALILLSERWGEPPFNNPSVTGQWFDDNLLTDEFYTLAGYIVEYPPLPESQPVPVNSPLGLALLLVIMLMVGLYRISAAANT